MPQLSLYIDQHTLKRVRLAAKRSHTSVSRWVRSRIAKSVESTWPEDFFDRDRCGARAGACGELDVDFGDCSHSLAEVEHSYISQVIEKTRGNQSRAAQILQISRKTLRNKLQSGPNAPSPAAEPLRSAS